MALPPAAALAQIVPDTTPAIPSGFTRIRQALDAGVPARVRLSTGIDAVLVVPTGQASLWRDADFAAVVSDGSAATLPASPSTGNGLVVTAAPHLLVRVAGVTVASVPLIAGLHRAVPDAGDRHAAVEIVVLSWLVTAGTMRGPGPYGSWVEIGWRRADGPEVAS